MWAVKTTEIKKDGGIVDPILIQGDYQTVTFWYQKVTSRYRNVTFRYRKVTFWYQKVTFWSQEAIESMKNVKDVSGSRKPHP